MLGGSSNINFLTHIRGSRHDYDLWAELGCKGWSFKEVLPYFIKSESHYAQETLQEGIWRLTKT